MRAIAVDGKIPLAVKIIYTAFVAVLVPVYWTHYGPLNFLYFCDLALLITLAGIWLESPLLFSMAAVGILAPQMIWIADYTANLFGVKLLGMTDYMFDSAKPLLLRGLSLFHGWLPFLLVYGVAKLGYDKRAFPYWTVLAWVNLFIAYFLLPAPSLANPDAVANVNYVYGFGAEPQTFVPGWFWFVGELVILPLALIAPMHLLLNRLFGAKVAAR